MKRVTGYFVRKLRRRIAKKYGVSTSDVTVFRGHEDNNHRLVAGCSRGRWRVSRRHTWRVVIGADEVCREFSWSNIKSFCEGFKSP